MEKQNLIEVTKAITTILTVGILAWTLTIQPSTFQQYGTYGIFLASFALDLIPQSLSPITILIATLLTTTSNPITLIIATILGSTLGSILGFAIGRTYMFKAVNSLTSKQTTSKITRLANKYGKIILTIAAISPFPYLPILFGALNTSLKNFIIYGLIPRAIAITIYGLLITSL